ncbi:MAG: hypothetical protein R6V36_08640 [Psychroflexus sp.]
MTEEKYTDFCTFPLLKISSHVFERNDYETLNNLYEKVIIWANHIALNTGRKICGVNLIEPNPNNPLSIMYILEVTIQCTEEEKKNGLVFEHNV